MSRIIFSSPPANVRNLYVSTAGYDYNPGTQIAPWRTISHAASVVNPGDIVHVAPGVYNGTVVVTRGGSETARIRFVSDTKWAAKIIGIFQPRADYISIENFELTNPSGTQGIETLGSYTNILGNKVHSISGGCPSVGGAGIHTYRSNNNLIENNIVYDIGNFNGIECQLTHNIYIEGYNDTIQNNLSYHSQGWGIVLWHGATAATIANNTIFNNLVGGILVGCGDADCIINDYTKVVNNIVVYNGSLGGRYGISEDGVTGIHNIYWNNLTYANLPANYYLQNGLNPVNAVMANPQFINYQANGSGDYHLKSISPAIDKGTTSYAPTIDIEGKFRVGAPDIGAYEYSD